MALPITIGTAATTFANGEFTVAAGESKVLAITRSADAGMPGNAKYELARKTSGGAYVTLITLTGANILDFGRIDGGTASTTYAARRLDTGESSGLEIA